MTTYKLNFDGATYKVTADWARAESPIVELPGRQVADFLHRPERALRELIEQDFSDSGMSYYLDQVSLEDALCCDVEIES